MTVTVIDIDDHNPRFDPDQATATIREHSHDGSIVFTLRAKDEDDVSL